MVEVSSQFDEFGRLRPGRPPGAVDIFGILCAAGVSAPRGRSEYRCAANTVVAHGRDGVFDVGFPVAVAEIDWETQLRLQLGDQRPVDLVDRRDPLEVQ